MAKYFIDSEIYWQGKRQPPRKVILPIVEENDDKKTALCYDEDWNAYILDLSEIFDDNIIEDQEIDLFEWYLLNFDYNFSSNSE